MTNLSYILALGSVAHSAVLASLQLRRANHVFGHGRWHALPGGLALVNSYHCSRYNTNTGRLTETMFEAVFAAIRTRMGLTQRTGD